VNEYNSDWSNGQVPDFKFNGKELDEENGMYYFEARYQSPPVFISRDVMFEKYPTLSPYSYCANNPLRYIDPTGKIIDVSALTASERELYEKQIATLKKSKLFATYYTHLEKSQNVYTIHSGSGKGGSGSFETNNNAISAILTSLPTIAQELFHAYQSDINVYNKNDRSVRETEGDIVTSNIIWELALNGFDYSDWSQGIGTTKYVDSKDNFDKSIFSEEFDNDFNKAVDARIKFYKQREIEEEAEAPVGYIQKNSKVGALALKRLVREFLNDENQ
jgi:RHS repeat-associated protein